MKKFVLCLTAVLFAAGTAHAEYVRKRIRPNFFIPARELERAEKLPPFPEPAEEPDNGEEIHYVIPAQTPSPAAGKASAVVVDHETPPEKVHWHGAGLDNGTSCGYRRHRPYFPRW